jgi:hypothetical protein
MDKVNISRLPKDVLDNKWDEILEARLAVEDENKVEEERYVKE